MEDFQERLNTISSKISYLGAEKLRIEKEQKVLEEELAKEGITDIASLPEIIKKKELELAATTAKFGENLTKFELKVAEIEKQVQ